MRKTKIKTLKYYYNKKAEGNKEYWGTFDYKQLDNLISKIKNPVLHSDFSTILSVLNSVSNRDNNFQLNTAILLAAVSGKDMNDIVRELIVSQYRFDLLNKEYNLFGLKVPIIIHEDNDPLLSAIFIANEENDDDYCACWIVK